MVRHFVLANDLFSFDKEQCERDTTGAAIFNTVAYLRTLTATSTSAAKSMVLNLLWEVEKQMYDAYTQGLTRWTEVQILYAQRMIESNAGNFFFAATTYRYSKEAIKVHIDYASKLNHAPNPLLTLSGSSPACLPPFVAPSESTFSSRNREWSLGNSLSPKATEVIGAMRDGIES